MNDKERIEYLEKTLEMERELYVNIRELSKQRDREINALRDAYNMQIDLVKSLEKHIDFLVKTCENHRKSTEN